MKRAPRTRRYEVNKRPTADDIYVCCQCNAIVDETHVVKKSPFCIECSHGHGVVIARPALIAFLKGLGWGAVLMVGGAVMALSVESSRFAILAASGAICSALACKKMLEGTSYLKRPEPAKKVARQLVAEAAGAWIAVLLSTLIATG